MRKTSAGIRRIALLACVAGVMGIPAGSAQATLIAYEGFDYERRQWMASVDELGEGIAGLNGGVGWAGSWEEEGRWLSGIPVLPADEAGARTTPLGYTDSAGRSLVTQGNQIRTAFGNWSQAERPLAQPLGDLGSTVWLSFLGQMHGLTTSANRWAFVQLTSATDHLRLGQTNFDLTGNWGVQVGSSSANWATSDVPGDQQTMYLVRIDFPESTQGLNTISIWLNPPLDDETELGAPTMQVFQDYTPYDQVGVWGRFSTDFDEIRLGTTFESVTPFELAMLPGDANRDGRVDGEDFLIWQASFGIQEGATWDDGDFNGDGRVDGEDFLIWQAHFGSVAGSSAVTPEPGTLTAILGLGGLLLLRRRRHRPRLAPW